MKLLNITENEDGSATANLDLTKDEAQYLMQKGFVMLLEEAIKEDKSRRRYPALFQGKDYNEVS